MRWVSILLLTGCSYLKPACQVVDIANDVCVIVNTKEGSYRVPSSVIVEASVASGTRVK